MEVQIFGIKNDSDTRKALRFFKERRVKVHFVDLKQRAASPGELKRFAQKFGVASLVNTGAKRYTALGLGAAHRTDERWLAMLAEDPLILRLPLVRWQQRLTVGPAESEWRDWVS